MSTENIPVRPSWPRRLLGWPRGLPEWLLIVSCCTGLVAFLLPWWSTAQRWAFWRSDQQNITTGLSLVTVDGNHALLVLPLLFVALLAVLWPIHAAAPAGAARWSRVPLAVGAALTALTGSGVAAGDRVVGMLTVRSVVEITMGIGGLLTCAAAVGVLAAGWWLTGRHIARCTAT